MLILPIKDKIWDYIYKRQLEDKFKKQLRLLEQNFRHPSLNVEILEPKHLRIYSFRVDSRYRVLFIIHNSQALEVLKVTDHYK
jgi:Txe/YoeB family toxin of Txe-Axe toxin-antitoxin module